MVKHFLRNECWLTFFANYCIQSTEAIHRKGDSNHQDLAFFRRHFVAFGRKKGEVEASALYALRCDIF